MRGALREKEMEEAWSERGTEGERGAQRKMACSGR